MAVYLCAMAQDFTGKYIAIWLPISAFVAIGFEHMPANCFTLPCGYIASKKLHNYNQQTVPKNYYGDHQGMPSPRDIMMRNIVPATLGNLFAGSVIMTLSYSFAYGYLGVYLKSTWQERVVVPGLKRYPQLKGFYAFLYPDDEEPSSPPPAVPAKEGYEFNVKSGVPGLEFQVTAVPEGQLRSVRENSYGL